MTLETRLLAAHAADDRRLLAHLYAEAAAEAADEDAEGFYLTQAYIFALEAGEDAAERYHARLKTLGREA